MSGVCIMFDWLTGQLPDIVLDLYYIPSAEHVFNLYSLTLFIRLKNVLWASECWVSVIYLAMYLAVCRVAS